MASAGGAEGARRNVYTHLSGEEARALKYKHATLLSDD